MQQLLKTYAFLATLFMQFPSEALQLACLKEQRVQAAPVIITSLATVCALSLLNPHVRKCIDRKIIIPLQARWLNVRYGTLEGEALKQEIFQAIYDLKQLRKILLIDARVGEKAAVDAFKKNMNDELLQIANGAILDVKKMKRLLKFKQRYSVAIEDSVVAQALLKSERADVTKLIEKYASVIVVNPADLYQAAQKGDIQ